MKLTRKHYAIISIIIVVVLGISFMGYNIFLFFNDENPPRIVGNISYEKEVEVNNSVSIALFTEDRSGIDICSIIYRVNNSEWITKPMRLYAIICCPPRYLIRIGPFYSVGIRIDFYFEIVDHKGNKLISDMYLFTIV